MGKYNNWGAELLLFFSLLVICYGDADVTEKKGLMTSLDPLPLWKRQFIDHRKWIGFYRHDGGNYDCTLKINSVGISGSETAYVTFTAEHVNLDMTVWSGDDVMLTFKESSLWEKKAHFEGHTNLVFEGELLPYLGYYHFVGNVSSNEMRHFGSVTFKPKAAMSVGRVKDDDAMKYGLSIGIPVAMALCLTASGIGIIYWAFKKGYLRHIPRAYKNFTNPRNAPNSTNNDTTDSPDGSSGHEMTTGAEHYQIEQPGSVHI